MFIQSPIIKIVILFMNRNILQNVGVKNGDKIILNAKEEEGSQDGELQG